MRHWLDEGAGNSTLEDGWRHGLRSEGVLGYRLVLERLYCIKIAHVAKQIESIRSLFKLLHSIKLGRIDSLQSALAGT